MEYVYIIKSQKFEKIYIGTSGDLRRRINEHNNGKSKSTEPYAPWKLIYYEAHLDKSLARRAEIFYKSSQGRRQLRKKLGLDLMKI